MDDKNQHLVVTDKESMKIKLFMQHTDPEILHNIIKFIHCGANFEWFCTVKKKKYFLDLYMW